MHTRLLGAYLTMSITWLAASPALACGGMVQTAQGTVSQTGQFAILSVHDAVTDVTLALDLPAAGNDFGVLIPVPVEPRIDPAPVSADALDSLEESTRPVYYRHVAGGSQDSGCAADRSKSAGGDFAPSRGVVTGEAVKVGDVSAVWLQGSSGEAVSAWLAEREFVLPDHAADLLDQYIQEGLSFIAFTRNQRDAKATRVGVRFTLAGDRRAYALRMTQLGAAGELTFNLFVATAADHPVGPDAPYAALSPDELVIDGDYKDGVRRAVAAARGKAFVIESFGAAAALPKQASALFAPGAYVTRFSTVAKPSDLDFDVTFTRKSELSVQRFEELADAAEGTRDSGSPVPPELASLLFVLGSVMVRRRLGGA